MFHKILIANRGEIACRVIGAARRLGVRSVAVYSDADVNARHVRLADEARRLGPPPAAESYLRGDVLIDIAKRAGAEAIHPGCGFLSENPDFADAVAAAGLRFIGPSAASIRAMGLKDEAKRRMQEAGVPVTPGYLGDDQDAKTLASEAKKIGYPVLIKARAGGGGKGMRRVDDPKHFAEALASAKREAAASFGDDAVILEKWIERPRHIEVQVFGDDHGDVVHLYERDCSMQRRGQKVIEESPAPGMTPEMRAAMCEAAVMAAQAIEYSGAGTIEFIVDASDGLRSDRFYFMEMNTRLQVEHPVTEAVLGLDLVEWQLRVAAGEKLPKAQNDISLDGWAMEARLYAEDPAKGFLPAIGRLERLTLSETMRVDRGVDEGDLISPHYDPMIAKLIAHGADREAARRGLNAALKVSRIAGVTTNLGFLSSLLDHDAFAAGDVDTGLIERELEALVAEPAPSPQEWAIAVIDAIGAAERKASHDPWKTLTGWRGWSADMTRVRLTQGDLAPALRVARLGADHSGAEHYRVEVDSEIVDIAASVIETGKLRIRIGDRQIGAELFRTERSLILWTGDRMHVFTPPAEAVSGGADAARGDEMRAPMPGLVKQAASLGEISEGDTLVILEAMKMEHRLTAPRAGRIAEMLVSEGEQVEEGDLLARLKPEDGS